MYSGKELKDSFLEELRNLDINWLNYFARKNHEEIEILYNNGIIDDRSICDALEIGVLKQARIEYELLLKGAFGYETAEDIIRRDFFVYALKQGEFSDRERKKISYYDEETEEEYIRLFGNNNLISYLREQLLNPTPSEALYRNSDDGHCCCGE